MKKTLVILLLASFCKLTYSQKLALDTSLQLEIKDLNNEKVWINLNNTSFFPAEYLYFNFYCTNQKTNEKSNLSSIGYIGIKDTENRTVVTKRLQLNDGFGQGELFIPSSLKTGSYLLVGYTQWMLNYPTNELFQQEIYIINPYTNAKNKNRPKESSQSETEELTHKILPLDLGIKHQTREKITVELSERSIPNQNFPISISVRKTDLIKSPKRVKLKTAHQELPKLDSIWVPEHRGAFLQGQLTSVYSDSFPLYITQTGINDMIQAINSKNHRFKLINDQINDQHEIIIQDGTPYAKENGITFISLNTPENIDWQSTFVELEETQKNKIITRSLHNQIENNYLEFRPDSIQISNNTNFLKHLKPLTYNLNEYTRFASIKETIKEIITQVNVDKDKESEVVKIKSLPAHYGYKNALLLYNGIVIEDAKQLFAYDAREIDKFKIYSYPIVFGGSTYNGAIYLESQNANLNLLNRGTKIPNHLLIAAKKKYFQQQYEDASTLPDYRYQLFWNPKVDLKKQKTFSFYTSDVTGEFEICISGIDQNGEPFRYVNSFSVEDQL